MSGITRFPTTIVLKDRKVGYFFQGFYGCDDANEITTGIFNSDEPAPDNFAARIHRFDLSPKISY